MEARGAEENTNMRRATIALGFAALARGAALAAAGCTKYYAVTGPFVDCEDLDCGGINACRDGIIAQCADGENMRYHDCGDPTVCEAAWQTPGAYRCVMTM